MKQTLSPREEQILKMLLAEYSQAEIGRTLNLSHSRVHDVKNIIQKKWAVDSMVGLIKEAIKRGYIELEEDNFKTEFISKQVIYEYKESSKNKITIYLK
jgi:DNA-binding CsgD family transcriptional regulator